MNSSEAKPVALITGGAKRVGRAIALRLAAGGFDIAFTYLSSEAPANALIDEIEAKSQRAIAIKADLTDSTRVPQQIFSEFSATFNRLDLLVNNASIYQPAQFQNVDANQIRRFMAIHLESPLLLCKAFTPLLKSGRGSVVNMLDAQIERPIPSYMAYSASKAALWNLTLSLARELAPEVRVNGIAPGIVDWPADYPNDKREEYIRRVPLRREGTPEDVAETVWFLSRSNSYITGQILRLDGGRSIV